MKSKHPLDWSPWLGALAVVLCGLVYANSLQGVFVMDDFATIARNPNIESLWPLSSSMSAPAGSGASGRPIVALSFALNHAIGGREVFGYHLANVILHVLAGLALFGCVRRALLWFESRDERLVPATFGATLVACLWTLHPLHTAALNHVTYRNEVLLGLFYLLSLYSALRGFSSQHGAGSGKAKRWLGLSVVTCAIAMGCKESAVSLPLMVLFLNVTIFGQGWHEALRRHRVFYAGLASTWLLLAWIIASGDRGESVGIGVRGITSLDYLRTQAEVLPHYLRLALWPDPLVFDYRDWAIVASWGDVWLQALGVLAVFVAACVALLRRSVLGAVGVGLFAVLAPTSSFIPITGAVAAEHRLYLPLAGLLILLCVGAVKLVRWAGVESRGASLLMLAAGVLLAVPLGASTFLRNRDYQSGLAIWEDTIAKRPNNSGAWTNYGGVLVHLGRKEEALDAARHAAELDAGNHRALGNLGNLLREAGDLPGAVDAYIRGVAARPDFGPLRLDLGRARVQLGEVQEGWQDMDAALDLGLPQRDQLRVAFEVATVRATASDALLRDGQRALELAQQLEAASGGRNPRYMAVLAAAQAETGRYRQAVNSAQRALELAQGPRRAALAKELQRQLAEYQAGRPWRQAVQ